jgi:hypothetical protein
MCRALFQELTLTPILSVKNLSDLAIYHTGYLLLM